MFWRTPERTAYSTLKDKLSKRLSQINVLRLSWQVLVEICINWRSNERRSTCISRDRKKLKLIFNCEYHKGVRLWVFSVETCTDCWESSCIQDLLWKLKNVASRFWIIYAVVALHDLTLTANYWIDSFEIKRHLFTWVWLIRMLLAYDLLKRLLVQSVSGYSKFYRFHIALPLM